MNLIYLPNGIPGCVYDVTFDTAVNDFNSKMAIQVVSVPPVRCDACFSEKGAHLSFHGVYIRASNYEVNRKLSLRALRSKLNPFFLLGVPPFNWLEQFAHNEIFIQISHTSPHLARKEPIPADIHTIRGGDNVQPRRNAPAL